jgi:hypothetical protein
MPKQPKTFGQMTRAEMLAAFKEQLTDELLEEGVKLYNKRKHKCPDCGGKATAWASRDARGEIRIIVACLRCTPELKPGDYIDKDECAQLRARAKAKRKDADDA